MGSDAESLSLTSRLLSSVLNTNFDPIPETSTPVADLASTDGAHIVEVKRVTSPSMRELGKATSDESRTTRDLPTLSRRWSVVLEAATNSDSLPPMPDFSEPSAAERTALEKAGFRVTTKAEREAEFRSQHHGANMPTVRIKGLIDGLVPHFMVLEANRITGNSYSWHHWGRDDGIAMAQRAILSLTGGALVSSFEPTEAPTGVDIHLGWGYVRTERAATIAGRIQTWLDSGLSSNLRKSLPAQMEGVTRHAVLVFDSASEPEFGLASSDASFVPTGPLALPAEVDILWAVFGERALCFSTHAGWSSRPIPSTTPAA